MEKTSKFDERLKQWPIPPLEQSYQRRDAALYALSVGVGDEPTDRYALPYLLQERVEPLPTFPTVLAANSPWLFDPNNGIDSQAIILRELSIQLEDDIPPEGTVVFHERVDQVWDRGAEKGAVIHLVGPLKEKHSGRVLATIERVTIALRNGGFEGTPPPADRLADPPAREPDGTHVCRTRADAALLFRLHGDVHPLHWDIELATRFGHPKPLLHGMCTLGIAGYGVIKSFCPTRPGGVKSMRMLFKLPVYPGDTLLTKYWRDDHIVRFRCWVEERGVVVADGIAQLATTGAR